MDKHCVCFLGIFLLTDLLTSTARGQAQTDTLVYQAKEVIVVASPIIEGNVSEVTGTQVTVVSALQVRDMNALDVPSALRRVPGVMISRHNLVGSYGRA